MAFTSFCINGIAHYGRCDYRPTPPTIIPKAIGFEISPNPGTLVLSGFENLNEIRINEGAQIDIGDTCLYAVRIINRTDNEIVLMVTDWESMQ